MSQTITQEVQIELSTETGNQESPSSHYTGTLSKVRSSAIILTIASVSFLNTLGSGLLTVALPAVAKDLNLPHELLLW